MNRLLTVVLGAMLAFGAAGSPGPALAAEAEADEEGFSAYSVARVKIFQGTAWIRSPDSGEWEETTTNAPITERSRVNIPEGSEAELQFHGGQFVLLTGGTEVDITSFNESKSSFRLRSGEIRFDLPAEDFSPVTVAVPGGKAEFGVPGRYWLFAQEDGQTRLTVRSGEAGVSTGKGVHSVTAGQVATIGQDVTIAAYEGAEEPPSESATLTEEERQAEVPPAAAYELRDYGDWVYSDEYGWVWQPRVASDWSPYYYGRWSWVSPYGWTWVSYEPWGWYPYHFGWWAADPFFGWVWCPFRSFVSVNFFFGHSRFVHFHRSAFFFPANVRFVRDGRSVRFVPLRPGDRFVRSGLTRSDTRLARFNRPLDRGSVFVRSKERGGKGEWREWSSDRRDHRSVKVRERGTRTGDYETGRHGPGRDERSTIRTETERSGRDRREVTQPRGQERPMQEREFRGRGGRGSSLGDKRDTTSPSLRQKGREFGGPSDRAERMGPSRSERIGRGGPSRSEQMDRGSSRRMESPRQVRERREAPSAWGGRARHSPPSGNYAPGRAYQPSGRGHGSPEYSPRSSTPGRNYQSYGRGMQGTSEGRGNYRGQDFRAPRSEGSFGRGEGRGGERFQFGSGGGGGFGGGFRGSNSGGRR